MEASAKKVAIDMVNELSLAGAAQARALAPVDSGELRLSIQESQVEQIDDEIIGGYGTVNDHAVYLEYGTGQGGISGAVANGQEKDPEQGITYRQDWKGMPAQPYMYPSAKEVERELPDTLAKYGKQLIGGNADD